MGRVLNAASVVLAEERPSRGLLGGRDHPRRGMGARPGAGGHHRPGDGAPLPDPGECRASRTCRTPRSGPSTTVSAPSGPTPGSRPNSPSPRRRRSTSSTICTRRWPPGASPSFSAAVTPGWPTSTSRSSSFRSPRSITPPRAQPGRRGWDRDSPPARDQDQLLARQGTTRTSRHSASAVLARTPTAPSSPSRLTKPGRPSPTPPTCERCRTCR